MTTVTILITTLLVGSATVGFVLFYITKYTKKNSSINAPTGKKRLYLIKKNKVIIGVYLVLMQVMIFMAAFLKLDLPNPFLLIIRVAIPVLFALFILRSLIIIRWLKVISKEDNGVSVAE